MVLPTLATRRAMVSLALAAVLSGVLTTLCAGWQSAAYASQMDGHCSRSENSETPPVSLADCCVADAGAQQPDVPPAPTVLPLDSLDAAGVLSAPPAPAHAAPRVPHSRPARPPDTQLLLSVFLI